MIWYIAQCIHIFRRSEYMSEMEENVTPVDPQELGEQVLNNSAENPVKPKLDWKQSLFKDLRDILMAMAVFIVIYVLFFRAVVVVGGSMNHTLVNGDRLLLISNVLYTNPQQGDVIVAAKDSFRDGEPIVKRIIATEGDWVNIDFTTGDVFIGTQDESAKEIHWQLLEEPYIAAPTTIFYDMSFPLKVPEGCVFVMGDNRRNSLDSRSREVGLIDEREILGKAIFLLIPGSDETHPFDLGRIGVIG